MYKIPESVLVVVHTPALDVLLLRRADSAEDFWQSVTGSKDFAGEDWAVTAAREAAEETGIQAAAAGCAPRVTNQRRGTACASCAANACTI